MLSDESQKFMSKKNKEEYKKFQKNPSFLSFHKLIKYGKIPRPHYALGLLLAAQQALDLKIKTINVLEFGCWNFDGLIDLENYCKDINKFCEINFNVSGFTLKDGLPKYKSNVYDRMYRWSVGDYQFTKKNNIKKLKFSNIYFGDVKFTIKEFLNKNKSLEKNPIGFIAFDLDYYTSTKNALKILKLSQNSYLPRLYSYFDDHYFSAKNEGERKAIEEFNSINSTQISDLAEFAEQYSLYFNKWIFLGKRLKVINYFKNKHFNKRTNFFI